MKSNKPKKMSEVKMYNLEELKQEGRARIYEICKKNKLKVTKDYLKHTLLAGKYIVDFVTTIEKVKLFELKISVIKAGLSMLFDCYEKEVRK